MNSRRAYGLLGFLVVVFCGYAQAEDRCVVCGKPPAGDAVYIVEDKVTHQKVEVCEKCEKSFTDCYICGLPANPDVPGFVRLPDERVLCARDAKTAVLREEDGFRIFHEVRDAMDGRFSRFTSFPDTNIELAMVDRVHLQELFTLAGNDYHCPNILGYTQSTTNGNTLKHQISLMTALPLSWLQSVCAHELSHTWVAENVPAARRKTLAREAEEGFCELMAFMEAVSHGDEAEKSMILSNGYTRGQIDLFIAAEAGYGLNDVLDWMRYGTDSKLSASDPTRIHEVSLTPRKTVASGEAQKAKSPLAQMNVRLARDETPPTPSSLKLKAVFWDPKRPSALINDHTFGVAEEASLRLGATNVHVRCVAITPNSVRIRVEGVAQEQELFLDGNHPRGAQ